MPSLCRAEGHTAELADRQQQLQHYVKESQHSCVRQLSAKTFKDAYAVVVDCCRPDTLEERAEGGGQPPSSVDLSELQPHLGSKTFLGGIEATFDMLMLHALEADLAQTDRDISAIEDGVTD